MPAQQGLRLGHLRAGARLNGLDMKQDGPHIVISLHQRLGTHGADFSQHNRHLQQLRRHAQRC